MAHVCNLKKNIAARVFFVNTSDENHMSENGIQSSGDLQKNPPSCLKKKKHMSYIPRAWRCDVLQGENSLSKKKYTFFEQTGAFSEHGSVACWAWKKEKQWHKYLWTHSTKPADG